MLGGLLAARRLALRHDLVYCGGKFFAMDQASLLRTLDYSIRALLDFITCRQVQTTGHRMQVSPGFWGIGHLYEIMEEASAIYPENSHLKGWMELLAQRVLRPDIAAHIGGFHRHNALAPMLRTCPEFLAAGREQSAGAGL